MKLGRAAFVLLLAAAPAAAQVPDKFTNLQVLPKEIPRPRLVLAMRAFASALEVRCNHCHVGKNPDDLETFDFASDEKEAKRVARAMMKMTDEINTRLLPQIGRTPAVKVECMTCHHGLKKPEQLVDVLGATAEKDGADAAIRQYGELREKYYGRAAYDFSMRTLNTLAERLAREKDLAGGIAVQEFNVKVNPGIASSHSLLAELYLQKGDKDAARANYEKAAALEPDAPYWRKRLEELRAPSPAPR